MRTGTRTHTYGGEKSTCTHTYAAVLRQPHRSVCPAPVVTSCLFPSVPSLKQMWRLLWADRSVVLWRTDVHSISRTVDVLRKLNRVRHTTDRRQLLELRKNQRLERPRVWKNMRRLLHVSRYRRAKNTVAPGGLRTHVTLCAVAFEERTNWSDPSLHTRLRIAQRMYYTAWNFP